MLLIHRIYFYNIVILSFFKNWDFGQGLIHFDDCTYIYFKNVIKNWLHNNISIGKITKNKF